MAFFQQFNATPQFWSFEKRSNSCRGIEWRSECLVGWAALKKRFCGRSLAWQTELWFKLVQLTQKFKENRGQKKLTASHLLSSAKSTLLYFVWGRPQAKKTGAQIFLCPCLFGRCRLVKFPVLPVTERKKWKDCRRRTRLTLDASSGGSRALLSAMPAAIRCAARRWTPRRFPAQPASLWPKRAFVKQKK